MFERFTDRARRVVVLAQDKARKRNHNYVGTEHLLLALVDQDAGAVRLALAGFSATQERVAEKLDELVPDGNFPPSGHIPFTIRSKKALEYSLRVALNLGHDHIAPEHLLLGMLAYASDARGETPTGVRILNALGVPLDDLRQVVVQQAVVGAVGQVMPAVYPQSGPERLRVNLTVLPRRLEEMRIRLGSEHSEFKRSLADFLEQEVAYLREEAGLVAEAEEAG